MLGHVSVLLDEVDMGQSLAQLNHRLVVLVDSLDLGLSLGAIWRRSQDGGSFFHFLQRRSEKYLWLIEVGGEGRRGKKKIRTNFLTKATNTTKVGR